MLRYSRRQPTSAVFVRRSVTRPYGATLIAPVVVVPALRQGGRRQPAYRGVEALEAVHEDRGSARKATVAFVGMVTPEFISMPVARSVRASVEAGGAVEGGTSWSHQPRTVAPANSARDQHGHPVP